MNTRRRFIATSAAAAAGAGLASLAGGSTVLAQAIGTISQQATTAGPMARPIASGAESIPVIGAGTSGSFDVAAGSPEYAALKEVLRIFFEGGARLIDTSPNYGAADAVLGRLLEEGGW